VRALVTGAAGFIGSNLCDVLVGRGATVRGVDSFNDYYDPQQKRANQQSLPPGVELIEADLVDADLSPLLDGIDVVFHLAGQPGVRLSWSDGFGVYEQRNVAVTQRMLEAVRTRPIDRFVFASSSSIYGNAVTYPTSEDLLPRPHSPYGVTKLAAEHLCGLYAEVYGVPSVALRYFTVFGPRQRPDMLMHRLIADALDGRAVPIFGGGDQVREFTYVGDVAEATARAGERDLQPGTVMNIAGGTETSVADVIALVGELVGTPVELDHQPAKAGDVQRTAGSIERARHLLDWEPVVTVRDGVAAQLAWHRERASGAT
jgi:nucleoside-diphosphate-sugar epimerase